MDRILKVGETPKSYFDIRLLDNVTPALNEAGNQPQTSLNGASFSTNGISTLVSIGFGKYYATLSLSGISVNDIIQTRYSNPGITAESRGDTFLVTDNDFTLANTGINSFEYYGTYNEADRYFSLRLNSQAWINSTIADRISALRMATSAINRLNFAGDKYDINQNLQFPRGTDTNIPDDIKEATYLCAIRFLDGWDMDMELDNLKVIQNKFSQASSIYNQDFVNEWTKAGIPSGTAWQLLRPYLRDPLEVSLVRIS